MPRAPKFCGALGCTAKVSATYCAVHRAEAQAKMDAKRGTSRRRGYDSKHDSDAIRAKADAVSAGMPCPRCGQPIKAGQQLDFGHAQARVYNPSGRASRVEHAHCNRSARHLEG